MLRNGRTQTPSADQAALKIVKIVDASSSTTPMAPRHAHILARRACRGSGARPRAQRACRSPPPASSRGLALEQIERGIGGGAGERIAHEGRAVHQRVAGIVGPEGVEDLARCATVAASGSVPPVSALRQGDDVGHHLGRLAGEHRAGAAEAGEDLVEDQQQLVAVGGRAQAAQHVARRGTACRRRPAPAARR